MPLLPGTRLGPYEITAVLGAGGMGEVYRARDTRLQRQVAVKIVPAAVAADPVARNRFEREAQAVAALSHPNILALHDVGDADGVTFAVMELLEGRSLRDVVADGPLPQRKAIEFALQIAHGLAAAHDRGIVHRDLKPGNIFLTSDGQVKILDFGLARITGEWVRDLSGNGTTGIDTSPGTVVGTVGYMAPEQVRGQATDHRSDLFSFGAVFYEMLSGQRAFQGATPADVMSAVLRSDPAELSAASTGVGLALDRIVRRCLEKDPAQRFQSARDLAFAIDSMSSSSTGRISPIVAGRRRGLWRAAALVAVGLAAGFGAAVALRPQPTPPPPLAARFTFPATFGARPWVSLSPDGRSIAWSAVTDPTNVNAPAVMLRRLSDAEPRVVLPNADPAGLVAWSRDSRHLFVMRGTRMLSVDVDTGDEQVVFSTPENVAGLPLRGVDAAADDTLLVGLGNGIYRFAPGMTAPEAVTLPEAGKEAWRGFPTFLPDGKRFLYVSAQLQTVAEGDVFVGSFDGTAPVRLDLPARVSRVLVDVAGYLLFGLDGDLVAQPFDLATATLHGSPVRVASDVIFDPRGPVAADLSPTGVLAFRTASFSTSQFEWLDRSGRFVQAVSGPALFTNFDLAPDGTHVVASRRSEFGRNELWMIDTVRNVTTTIDVPGAESISDPTWSPDGQRIAYRRGQRLVLRAVYGGEEQVLAQWPGYPDSFSRDGKWLAVGRPTGDAFEIWAVRLDGTHEEIPVVTGIAVTDEARFSPDGKWLTYHAAMQARPEVYVVPFPPTGERWQLSQAGGVQPRWRGDGRELYYLEPGGRLMAVDIPNGDPRQGRTAAPLFRMPVTPSPANDQFTPRPDGSAFLVRRPVDTVGVDQSPVHVLIDWRYVVGLAGGTAATSPAR